jgi:polo-like kinase 1
MNAYSFPETAIISEAAKNLITQILVTDPSKRPTLDQILTHDFFNQGTSIPKLLPTSTLACTPSLSYIRSFMPDAGKDGIVNKPLTTTKLNTVETSNKNNNDLTSTKSEATTNLNSGGDPHLKGPDTWVKKWVDYSSKYGLGYLLSNGFSGVFFNDSSKIILNPNTNYFFYIERRTTDKQEVIVSHNMNEYPPELKKKVTLLQHFKNYLEGENSNTTNTNTEKDKEALKEDDSSKKEENQKELSEKPFTYVKKWMRTRHAIMFRLSNKIVQVCFQDHTEIILSSESRIVTYVNKKGERSTYPLSTALENSNFEMTKRLKYTKDILTHMLNLNLQRSNQRKNQSNSESTNYQSMNK